MQVSISGWQYLQDGDLLGSDPAAADILRCEELRQGDKLIMIPSESLAPRAVQEALGSVFTNLYAEGYPSPRMALHDEAELADCELQQAMHRRFADRRFYRGTEFANLVESLAQRRVAHLFATDGNPDHGVSVPPERIHANVQALSGAAANNAVYSACLEPGDTILGMSLSHGGHLTHGSPYNRSGRYYNAVSYGVSERTGKLDYDEVERMALAHKPKLIVAGASAYPWDIDWRRLREVADRVPGRALLLADIAHPAGLVVAGLFPNPIGYADVVTFTTHKTMIGPRGAVILSTDEELARNIDRAVFPGEQGGPHLNNIAAMAVAFEIARTEQFRDLQRRIAANAVALADGLRERGLGLAYGGTNTHLLLVDLRSIRTESGVPVKGDVAARLLDLCGIVCNKNTIPGDLNANYSSAIRLGTVWVTQRGLGPKHMDQLAAIMHGVLTNVKTLTYYGSTGDLWRGKVRLPVLQEATAAVREIVDEARTSERTAAESAIASAAAPETRAAQTVGSQGEHILRIRGPRAQIFLHEACTADILALKPGAWTRSFVLDAEGATVADVLVGRPEDNAAGPKDQHFLIVVSAAEAGRLEEWFRALSDGYVIFDNQDILGKVEGPVVGEDLGSRGPGGSPAVAGAAQAHSPSGAPALGEPERGSGAALVEKHPDRFQLAKPYFVGQPALPVFDLPAKAEYVPRPYDGEPRPSSLYDEHLKLTARRNMIPFGGWSMPVWYTSIGEEHRAVRTAAGLFDVSHMGVLEVRGEQAARFLDLVTTNYVRSLRPGQTQYSYILDPNGSTIDDILVYCLAPDRYILVVNAANAEKDKAWLDAVNSRAALIDRDRPAKEVDATVEIRDLKDPSVGDERRVDLSLQGPRSLAILQSVIGDGGARRALARLHRGEFTQAGAGGVDALISRTGYTGEESGYELYVHPDRAPEVWRLLLAQGAADGLKPTALGARDSTRTEAGFPLYGHELAGPYDITPAEAGYGSFVKLHKPFFVGREAFVRRDAVRKMEVVRFAVNERGVRMAKNGDPVVNKRGECIGYVTSAVAVDGQQVGLAYVDRRYTEAGTALGIFPLPRGAASVGGPAKDQLKIGDRLTLHQEATVLPRFLTKSE